MNNTPKPLGFCLAILLAGPSQGSDAAQGPPSHHRQSPIVSGPVVAPALSSPQVCELPACPHHGRHCGVRSDRRRFEPPFSPAPVNAGVPFGASNRALFGAQVANGQAAWLVLYQYDFLPGKAALAPAGVRKLERLTPLLLQSPFPLVIEPAGSSPRLDAARRRNVIEHLEHLPVPAERIVVAPPRTRGISGVEARGLHARFMELMTGAGATAESPAEATTAPLP